MTQRPLRTVIILVLGLAGTVVLAQLLSRSYAVRSWLGWTLLTIYAWEAFLTVACAGFGFFVLTRVLRLRDLSHLEAFALGLPIGLVGFAEGMFAAGYLGAYGPTFAVVLPGAMSATWFLPGGAASRWMRTSFKLPTSFRLYPASFAAALFGALCLAVMYVELVSPDALNYDSTWYHLVVSQDYAREGRIVPFMASWTMNVAHLTSIVQTWCFILPGPWPVDHPVRWMLTLHTEFTIFLWTLVTVAAALNWSTGRRVSAGWAAFFLFPSIFVYDSNLGGSADHFLALFAAPLLLATGRAIRGLRPADCALVGILGAGATMTKLQSVYMLAPIALVLACRWIQLAAQRLLGRSEPPPWKSLVSGPLLAVAVLLVLASPQAIENWVWYHNPVYPFMPRVFVHSTPTMPDAAVLVENYYADWHWQAPTPLRQRIIEALELAVTFSFEPHYSFIGDRPYFGSLFTVLSPLLLFLPNAKRLWLAFVLAMGALFLWGFTYRVDRNLQTFLPMLVVVTGAIIARAWDLGTLGRVATIPLIALQVVWGGDLMFSGNDRFQAGVALLKSGYDGRAEQRFDGYRQGFRAVGKHLPVESLSVLHNAHLTLGMNRRILLDWIGFQGLIDYRAFRTPREMYDRFAELGVTHLIVIPGWHPADTKQEEVIFHTFVSFYAKRQADVGGFVIYEMPASPPPAQRPLEVLSIGLGGYSDGVYRIQDLGTVETLPPRFVRFARPEQPVREAAEIEQMLGGVDAALIASSYRLVGKASEVLNAKFRSVATFGSFSVYGRIAAAGAGDSRAIAQ
jgi:hypothetical protein